MNEVSLELYQLTTSSPTSCDISSEWKRLWHVSQMLSFPNGAATAKNPQIGDPWECVARSVRQKSHLPGNKIFKCWALIYLGYETSLRMLKIKIQLV